MSGDQTIVTIKDLRCTWCVDDVLKAVRSLEGVRSAELDYQRSELRVDYDPVLVDEEAVCRSVRERGYRCDGDAGETTTGQLAHAAQLAPITCGTKCDRMQYGCRTRPPTSSTTRARTRATAGCRTTCQIPRWPRRWSATCATASSSRSPLRSR